MFINKDKISARLCEEREKTGLKQEDFAALAGTGIATQTRYETGKNLPKLDYLIALEAKGVDAGYILTGIRGGELSSEQEIILAYLDQMHPSQRAAFLQIAEGLARLPQPAKSIDEVMPTATLHSPRLDYRAEEEHR